MTMRVRISLLPPFSPTKVLLPVPDTTKTISQLKKHLYRSLSSIAQHAEGWIELRLEIEGFELLAGSEINVIEEGDVVSVGLAASSSTKTLRSSPKDVEQKKRKVSASKPVDKPAKRQKVVAKNVSYTAPPRRVVSAPVRPPKAPAPEASSNSDSDSDSNSSSSASSSSTSSTETSSSSSASSSSGTSSSISPAKRPVRPPITATPIPPLPFPVHFKPKPSLGIPPGQGKPETQNRNVRRRRARQLKKLGEIGPDVPTAPASGDDALQVFGTPTLTTPGIVPSDMANRNKKKGFLREMRELRGSKTVFDERRDDTVPEATVNGDDVLDISVMEMAAAQEEKRSGRWPIPPSERSGLPSNVFVTSQEFKRTRVDRRPNGHAEKDVRAEVEEEEEMEGVQEEAIQNGHSEIDEAMELWKRAEADYETLEALNSDKLELLKAGSLIAWKELELDLVTFSPELKMHLGRVMTLDLKVIRLEHLRRPNDILDYDEEGMNGAEEKMAGIQVSDLNAAARKYRLIDFSS